MNIHNTKWHFCWIINPLWRDNNFFHLRQHRTRGLIYSLLFHDHHFIKTHNGTNYELQDGRRFGGGCHFCSFQQQMHERIKGTKRFSTVSPSMSSFCACCTEGDYHKSDPTPQWRGTQCQDWKRLQRSHQKSRSLVLCRSYFLHHTHEQNRLAQT